MPPVTNYSKYLGDQEPLATMRRNVEAVRTLTAGWTPAHFAQSHAPGKWTARQVITHLVQTELALGTRARMALSTPDYQAQSFDQDRWMARETRVSGAEAVDAFVALARFDLAFFEGLSAADREVAMTHPEYGSITVDWIIHLLAGHQLHHLGQLQTIR